MQQLSFCSLYPLFSLLNLDLHTNLDFLPFLNTHVYFQFPRPFSGYTDLTYLSEFFACWPSDQNAAGTHVVYQMTATLTQSLYNFLPVILNGLEYFGKASRVS